VHRLIAFSLVLACALVAVGGLTLLRAGRLDSALAQEASSAASPAADCPATTPEENEALVRRYIEEAYNGRNPDAFADLLADDYVLHNAAAPQQDQQPGFTDDIARLQTWLTTFPDLHIAIEKIISAEDTVVGSNVWTGTQEGPFPQWGAPATGRPMSRESIIIWRVECGLIAESWIVQDNLTMLRQLGIITDEELATVGTPTVATPAP
jgi:steroid delta-isomerase-like uncharacterized protein